MTLDELNERADHYINNRWGAKGSQEELDQDWDCSLTFGQLKASLVFFAQTAIEADKVARTKTEGK